MSSQQSKLRYFVLSLFAPGLGAADQSQWKKAFAIYGLVLCTMIVFGFLALLGPLGYIGGAVLLWGTYIYQCASVFWRKDELSDYARSPLALRTLFFVLATVLMISARTFIPVKAFTIPSGNMIPTVEIGSYVVANKYAYISHPIQRGDVVVFRYPEDETTYFMKRVIAIGGDTLEITSEGKIIINDIEVPQKVVGSHDLDGASYSMVEEENGLHRFTTLLKKDSEHMGQDKITVPENAFFVLGDNRDNSNDSRYWGNVPLENLVGRIEYQVFSGGRPSIKRIE